MKALIQTPTPDLEKSKEFYSTLKWKQINESPCIVSDGKAVVMINPDRFARAGIVFYKDSWTAEKEKLAKDYTFWATPGGLCFMDPSGTWIYLNEGPSPVKHNPEEKSFGITGNLAGLSMETSDMEKSYQLYTMLGFEKTMGGPEQGWLAMDNDEGFGISFMKPMACPHLFFNPSFTYFNGKEGNKKVIADIQNAGIPITEEITHFNKEEKVDNIIIRDPGGFGFFLFNDG
ncbi:MAG: hypothetical protein HKN16_00140 [Saprospiraceae bacterium]|nr:hypothetical protein [Saprospiraceae bacterium]